MVLGQATRGKDRNEPTRTITSRSGMQSFTNVACEAGYHSHGDRKCHPVTSRHNGETIQDMGGERAYRMLHSSIRFNQPIIRPNNAMYKALSQKHNILLKQGYNPYDAACPEAGLHGHPGRSDCHRDTEKHRRKAIEAMGGWQSYRTKHPSLNLPDEDPQEKGGSRAAAASKPAAKKPTRARRATATRGSKTDDKEKPTNTRTRRRTTTARGTETADKKKPTTTRTRRTTATRGTKTADKEKPATKRTTQRASKKSEVKPAKKQTRATRSTASKASKETAASEKRIDKLLNKLRPEKLQVHERKIKENTFMKFANSKEKYDYINTELLPKTAMDIYYNDALLSRDDDPYMLASGEPLVRYMNVIPLKENEVEEMEELRKKVPQQYDLWESKLRHDDKGNIIGKQTGLRTMYASKWRENSYVEKWNGVANVSKNLNSYKDNMANDLSQTAGSVEWRRGLMELMFYETGLRIGEESNVEKDKTYGISTLRSKHIKVRGNKIHLKFPGKKQGESYIKKLRIDHERSEKRKKKKAETEGKEFVPTPFERTLFNEATINVDAKLANQVKKYQSSLKSDDLFWGRTNDFDNRKQEREWNKYISNHFNENYSFSPHRIRAYSMNSELVFESNKQGLHKIKDPEERINKLIEIATQVAKNHTDDLNTASKNYYVPDVIDKLLEGKTATGLDKEIVKGADSSLDLMKRMDEVRPANEGYEPVSRKQSFFDRASKGKIERIANDTKT